MAIPDYQTVMLPFLQNLADGSPRRTPEMREWLADHFELSDAEREKLLPSGQEPVFSNRFGWARTYLKKSGLIDYPSRGVYQITDLGRNVLAENPTAISTEYLRRFEPFREWIGNSGDSDSNLTESTESDESQTPDEKLETAYRTLRDSLASNILEKLKSATPSFFERAVVEVLVAMGYGGSIADAGRAVGRSGDGGIDGIIKEDRLGLDLICIQAKRWTNTVGRPDIQAFAGSMEGFRAKKGVFITTSAYSREAYAYIDQIERKIVLIDGKQLAQFMIDFNVGVTPDRTYIVKQLDNDYFEEED
ncbi:restriction endonuclease [Stratiformator vulcanicus]|uniref:Mrr restriction system protein n=1 Tax=Stratiformator vulcanicus TaxID=2527980 RepID=A0A517R517_9PLAN|nr:restriction endonuclease [Stratiformator vulcanicus]QDT38913.1 Mrr restriction system protein [Stratiformator vulcanicus]